MGVSIPYVSFVLIVMEVAYLYICSGVRCAHAAADLLHVLTCLESHWTVLEAEQVGIYARALIYSIVIRLS